MINILELAKNAKLASNKMANIDTALKNKALEHIAKKIEENKAQIFEANKRDLDESKNIEKEVYNRLKLDENKLRDVILGLYDVVKLKDPINQIMLTRALDENLTLKQISCPIGVIGVIFEARPDVITQISALSIKSGNVVILKGGREAEHTNSAIFKITTDALNEIPDFPKNAINLVHSRDDVKELLALDEYINLIIPRGSNKLVKYIQENTKIPVLGHASGICHSFVDENALYDKALRILTDSKCQYPAACNSIETILVHKNFPYIQKLKEDLTEWGIEIFEKPDNWSYEYGEKKLSFKVVNSIDEAISHINQYSSHHTDTIITENMQNAELFKREIDSAGVFVNCSTRFSDGFRYGFGAEVGISTNKTHARGPVGLVGLTTYKYTLDGAGQIVDDYAKGIKTFHHKDL